LVLNWGGGGGGLGGCYFWGGGGGGGGLAAPRGSLSRHCARLFKVLPDPLLGLIGATLHKHVA